MTPTQAQQSQQVSNQRAASTRVFGASMTSLRSVAFALLVDRALSA